MAARAENSRSRVPAKQTHVRTYGHLRPCRRACALVLSRLKFKKRNKKRKNFPDLDGAHLSFHRRPAGGLNEPFVLWGFISCVSEPPLKGLRDAASDAHNSPSLSLPSCEMEAFLEKKKLCIHASSTARVAVAVWFFSAFTAALAKTGFKLWRGRRGEEARLSKLFWAD